MIILDDYSGFQYTRIQVPIKLNECPSDHEHGKYFIDVACDNFEQQKCYIGKHFVDKVQIRRLTAKESNAASQWIFTIILSEPKDESAVFEILDELCIQLSLSCAKAFPFFQYHGLGTFSYRYMDVDRRYALEDHVFGDRDFPRSGNLEMMAKSSVPQNVFELPIAYREQTPFVKDLQQAFLNAMRSTDPVARYILLYYLFELMYKSDEYRQTRLDIKKGRSRYRNIILFDYLRQQFQLNTYHSFDKEIELTPDILESIILTRDSLAHAADTSNISKVMYQHMIPMLQQILRLSGG